MTRWILPLLILTLGGLFTACGGKEKAEPAPETTTTQNTDNAATETKPVLHILAFDGVQDFHYLVHYRNAEDSAILYTPDEVHTLKPARSASGAKYQGERFMVWTKGQGDIILFEVDGKEVGPCKVSGLQAILEQAWQAGGRFWAAGNEPSWNLVISEEKVLLLTDLGETRQEFPGLAAADLDPYAPAGRHVLKSGDHTLEIEIQEGLCGDSMSGAPFPASVTLKLDGVEMRGCGTGLF